MKSAWQIASTIMNELRGGWQVDDNRVDWAMIYDKINDGRNILIEQYYKQNKALDRQFYSEICCLEIVCKPLECDGIKSEDVRTQINDFPGLLSINGEVFIDYFGPDDFSHNINYVTPNGIKYKAKGSIYTSGKAFYTRIGNTAILYNLPTDGFTFACLVAVLSNPLEPGCIKDTKKKPYPIPSSLVIDLENMVVNIILQTIGMLDPEQPNDANDNSYGNQQLANNSRGRKRRR